MNETFDEEFAAVTEGAGAAVAGFTADGEVCEVGGGGEEGGEGVREGEGGRFAVLFGELVWFLHCEC
jgi:hypothetical protein